MTLKSMEEGISGHPTKLIAISMVKILYDQTSGIVINYFNMFVTFVHSDSQIILFKNNPTIRIFKF